MHIKPLFFALLGNIPRFRSEHCAIMFTQNYPGRWSKSWRYRLRNREMMETDNG